MVLPCDNNYLRAQASQRDTYTVQETEFLPYEVERALVQLIHKELKLAGQSEMLKQDLACSYDFNLDNLYFEIDDCNFKFIDTSNMKRFLSKCGITSKDSMLIAIIRRLDLDADAKLNLKEFIEGV